MLRTAVPPHRLAELLLGLARREVSGRLRLMTGVGERTVYLHSGFPVFSQSSQLGERLGALAVRQGLLTRDHVARALTLAREQSMGIGDALLTQGMLDVRQLYELLGLQLREVLIACAGSAVRARFAVEPAALRYTPLLRMHPMTVALGSAMAMPDATRAELLATLAACPLQDTELPAQVVSWLEQVGVVGNADRLGNGTRDFAGLRRGLRSRLRPSTETHFDTTKLPPSLVPKGGPRQASLDEAADLIALSLVLAGALPLAAAVEAPAVPAGSGDAARDYPDDRNAAATAASLRLRVSMPAMGLDPRRPAVQRPDAERAIAAYLHGKPERSLAGAAAVWGPAIEAADPGLPTELLGLYLKLKPERKPERVLGLEEAITPETALQGHAARVEQISALSRKGNSLQTAARCAELIECCDLALDKIRGGGKPSLPPETPAVDPFEVTDDDVLIGSELEEPKSLAGSPAPKPAPERPDDTQAVSARVTAMLRQSDFQAVLLALEDWPKHKTMPFMLQLARAMAQREVARRTRTQPWALLIALAIGFLCGWLTAYLGTR